MKNKIMLVALLMNVQLGAMEHVGAFSDCNVRTALTGPYALAGGITSMLGGVGLGLLTLNTFDVPINLLGTMTTLKRVSGFFTLLVGSTVAITGGAVCCCAASADILLARRRARVEQV